MKHFLKIMYHSRLSLGITLGILFAILNVGIRFLFSNITLSSLIGAVIASAIYGTLMSLALFRSSKYFIHKVQNNEHESLRHFQKLYRKNLVPDDKNDYIPYDEYLADIEKRFRATQWAFYAGPILFGIMFILTIFITRQYSLCLFFGVAVLGYLYGWFWLKKSYAKIIELRNKMKKEY